MNEKNLPPLQINLSLHDNLFQKDPNSSDLGKKIVHFSVEMIDEIGFEAFTFKKLADRIQVTEPSVYRYFENKQKLLLYLFAWYWNWLDYKIMVHTRSMTNPEDKLVEAIRVFTQPVTNDESVVSFNLKAFYRIIISESAKVYLNKKVDQENEKGLYFSFKRLCINLADLVRAVNPAYLFPTALISTALETAHLQLFFSEHLPRLTDIQKENPSQVTDFVTDFVLKTIQI